MSFNAESRISANVSDYVQSAKKVVDWNRAMERAAKQAAVSLNTVQRRAGAVASTAPGALARGAAVGAAGPGAKGFGWGSAALLGGAYAGYAQTKQGITDALAYRRQAALLDRPLAEMGINKDDAEQRIGDVEARTGVDDSIVAGHLAKVLNAGERDLSNAMKKIGLALDVEAAGYGSADTVLSAMTKASAENTMMLKKMAQSMGITVDESATANEVIAQMNAKVGGLAEAAHKATGGLGAFSVSFDNARQKIGESVTDFWGPIIGKISDAISAGLAGDDKISTSVEKEQGRGFWDFDRDTERIHSVMDEFRANMESVESQADELSSKRSGQLTDEDRKHLAERRAAFKRQRDSQLASYGAVLTDAQMSANAAPAPASPASAAPDVSDKGFAKGKKSNSVTVAPPSSRISFEARVRTDRGTTTTITSRS